MVLNGITDPVKRWKLRISEATWRVYNLYWQKFLDSAGVTDPKVLLDLSSREAGDLLAQYHEILKREGYSSNSCSLGYTAVRSFFIHNGVKMEKFLKKFLGKPQYEQGYLVSQEQVFQLIEAIPQWHNKLAAAICFQGGQRAGVCTGLKFKHIETRNWQEAAVVVFSIPEFLPNRKGKNTNKWELKYRFALLDDAIRYLILHKQKRERNGEKIAPESWLINATDGVSRGNIHTQIVKAAEKVGIQRYVKTRKGTKKNLIHPHSGRPYFKAQLRQSGVDPDLREFMMGHKMPYNGAYDRFPESEIVEAMEKARKLLALVPDLTGRIEQRKQNILDAVRAVLPKEDLELLRSHLAYTTTNEEINQVLDTFKNGREKLEALRGN